MYTLEQLQQKSLNELKEIGWDLNVFPEGDRRRRQSWIDALVNVNSPLLQLLKDSPTEDVQAQESPIIETVEASPVAEDVQTQESPIESKFGRIVYPRPTQGAIVLVAENPPGVEVEQVQEPIGEAVETSPAAEAEQAQEPPIESKFGRIVYPNSAGGIQRTYQIPYITPPDFELYPSSKPIKPVTETSPGAEVDRAQDAISPVTKNLPGSRSKASTAHQLLELFQSRAHILEDSPGVKTEAVVSESAIAQAAKTSPGVESDQNPILTGLTFSAGFLARYSPPQPEIIHFRSDADGQLSLLNFEVESVDEPPDPDDFESLDAFCEAITRWDLEHPTSSFDHCSDLLPSSVYSEPNSVHCKPPDPHDFDSMFAFWAAYDAWDEATDDDSKPLEISLDSFCEWAPCPADWYESIALDGSSKVLEPSPVRKSSITSDFFIPTFGRLGDRSDKSDEPPDTGIFALLPKPKPPSFPPQASQLKSAQVSQASRNYPETIPELFHRVVAGSTLPARSPPGGDAGF